MDWIDKNPAILMEWVKDDVKPTDYFTKDQFKAIVDTFARFLRMLI
jgi:integrase/recombinase XerD